MYIHAKEKRSDTFSFWRLERHFQKAHPAALLCGVWRGQLWLGKVNRTFETLNPSCSLSALSCTWLVPTAPVGYLANWITNGNFVDAILRHGGNERIRIVIL